MKSLCISHASCVFSTLFCFFSFSFLGQLIGILDILLRNNASHSRFVSSLASSRLESSKTFFDF